MVTADRDAVGSTRCLSPDPTRRETPPVGCGSDRNVTHTDVHGDVTASHDRRRPLRKYVIGHRNRPTVIM